MVVAQAVTLTTAAQAAAATPVPSRTVRRGVRLTPSVSGWTPPRGWAAPDNEAGLGHVNSYGGRFSASCDERIKAVYYDRRMCDFIGETVDREEMYATSGQCLVCYATAVHYVATTSALYG